MNLTPAKQKFVDLAAAKYGEGAVITKQQVIDVKNENDLGWPSWFVRAPYKVGRGEYKLPTEIEIKTGTQSVPLEVLAAEASAAKTSSVPDTVTNLMMSTDIEKMIPEKFEGFVSWGYFKEIKSIIRSKMFYPIFVTGLSGNGKTLNVQEACAELNRECVRVNVTIETDEDDLIGGFRLVDGETKFNLGPVAIATGPKLNLVSPSTKRKPPIRSSSSVSMVTFTLTHSRLSSAQASCTFKVFPLPDKPVTKIG